MSHLRRTTLAATIALAAAACSGKPSTSGSVGGVDPDAYGASYQGDGVQCGAIVCNGAQQCCLVYSAPDASNSNPTHACDQGCTSVCADTCPDAGGQTQAGHPPAMGPGTGAMPPAPLDAGKR